MRSSVCLLFLFSFTDLLLAQRPIVVTPLQHSGQEQHSEMSDPVSNQVASGLSESVSLIPAGEFDMGNTFGDSWSDQIPVHTVHISAFYIDRYEVTKALWDRIVAHNGGNGYTYSGDNPGRGKGTNHPVHTVNWFDAVKWCNARSEHDGLVPVYYRDLAFTKVYKSGGIFPFVNWSANGYRLPTEAEWEKAARGGLAGQRFPWGNTISHSNATFDSTRSYDHDVSPTKGRHPTFLIGDYPHTSPVGYFAPNGFGLHDMSGNVLEWCWDWYDVEYYTNSPYADPRGPSTGVYGSKVARGGSFDTPSYITTVANRLDEDPGYKFSSIGFRCVRGL